MTDVKNTTKDINTFRVSQVIKSSNLTDELTNELRKADLDGDGTISMSELLIMLNESKRNKKTSRNLKKIVIVTLLSILLLAGSNLATSFIAAKLSREIEISLDGTIIDASTKKEVTTKSVGIFEDFWLSFLTKEEALLDAQSAENEAEVHGMIIGESCVSKDKVENLLGGLAKGTKSIIGFANVDNPYEERSIELSFNENHVNGRSCVDSSDGKYVVCFQEDEECSSGRRKLKNVQHHPCNILRDQLELQKAGHVANRLCSGILVGNQNERNSMVRQLRDGTDPETHTAPTPTAPTPKEPTPETPIPKEPTTETPIPKEPTPETPIPKEPTPETPIPKEPTPETPIPETLTAETAEVTHGSCARYGCQKCLMTKKCRIILEYDNSDALISRCTKKKNCKNHQGAKYKCFEPLFSTTLRGEAKGFCESIVRVSSSYEKKIKVKLQRK